MHKTNQNSTINTWLDRPLFSIWPQITIYHFIVSIILLVTIASRFVLLGERVMSHDEVNHVVPAYTFYTGGGYRYDWVTHGPLQFHLITLSYFLFGASDFSARIPDAVFGIAIVAFALFGYKRYLGRVGSLCAGFLFAISPYISFYSRYTRNEIFIVFWGMALLWGVLRYLESGKKQTLLFVTLITALHFTDKATSYIFTAILLIFLALLFIGKTVFKPWHSEKTRLVFLVVVVLTIFIGVGLFAVSYDALTNSANQVAEGSVGVSLGELSIATRILIGGLGVGLITGLIIAGIILVKGIGWHGIRDERSFDLLIMQGTLVLPLLAALPMDILKINPLDYSTNGVITSLLFIAPLLVVAALVGLWWNWKVWTLNMGIFWGIFTIFYTTLFTQGSGFIMGLTGALGYWLAQQGVERGTQPLYYYALVQIPMYEFLPAFGTLLAGLFGVRHLAKRPNLNPPDDDSNQGSQPAAEVNPIIEPQPEEAEKQGHLPEDDELGLDWFKRHPSFKIVDNDGEIRETPILGLLLFWSVMSLLAFSFAGERMPWLTTHITMPMILTSGLSFGWLFESIKWDELKRKHGWIVFVLLSLFLLTLFRTIGLLAGPLRPFQGNDLASLEITSNFLLTFTVMVISAFILYFLLKGWSFKQFYKFTLVLCIGILSIITIRTSYRANFILYDTAKEFLVYAHAARDPKDVLEQVEEISFRLTGGKGIAVAYDNDMLYPYWWYFRDYPNKRWFADNPTRDLRDSPIILVGSGNFSSIEPIVGNEYLRFDHTRLWWPSQAYFNLTPQRVWAALSNAEMRGALWQIWFNRNYEPYAQLANISTLTLENWQPSDAFRMYIRKDVVSQIWEYGTAPVVLEPKLDPYEANTISLDADLIVTGGAEFTLDSPRDIAFAPDGTFYVADSRNHRVLHLRSDGTLLNTFGTYGASDFGTQVMAPGGSFNEPWGVAVGPDGSVYVTDTWNHRVQKFSAQGKFLTMWGSFGAAESNFHFWGPRGVAVDQQGRVFITDTGNKRVVIFDKDGTALNAFGGAGFGVGQFDEPVGIDIDHTGRLYIADTWNKRVQIMLPDASGLNFPNHIAWDIDGWYGDTLDNKPFLTIDNDRRVFVADPVVGRILTFDENGSFLFTWGEFGSGPSEIGVAGGLAVDPQGRVWVADARNNRLMRFTVPAVSIP